MLHIAAVPAVHFLVSLVCQCPESPGTAAVRMLLSKLLLECRVLGIVCERGLMMHVFFLSSRIFTLLPVGRAVIALLVPLRQHIGVIAVHDRNGLFSKIVCRAVLVRQHEKGHAKADRHCYLQF